MGRCWVRTALYRLVHKRYADQALTGEGSRRRGSRWTRPGIAAVYAAETLSLAVLELYVQVAQQHARHIPLVYFRIELPETVSIEALRPQDLPESWNAYPYPETLQDLGTAWIRRGEALALYVPSAVVPTERNVILNPAHREFHKLRISTPQPFSLDERPP